MSTATSTASGITCLGYNNTLYRVPNGIQYQVQCNVDRFDAGNLAKSVQPSYEMCAQFCSGSSSCLSFSYVYAVVVPAVNCYLHRFVDNITSNELVWGGVITPIPPPSASLSRPSTTSTSSRSSLTWSTTSTIIPSPRPEATNEVTIAWYSETSDNDCHFSLWDSPETEVVFACTDPPIQVVKTECKTVPYIPEFSLLFNPWGYTNCKYVPKTTSLRRTAMKENETNKSTLSSPDIGSNGTESSVSSQPVIGQLRCDHDVIACYQSKEANEVIPCDGSPLSGEFVPLVDCAPR